MGIKRASERGFQDVVLQLAVQCGWRTIHLRPARTANGWRTAIQGQGKGFPDLLALRGSRLLAAELKMPGKKPTPEQWAWLAALEAVGAAIYVWFPDDMEEIRRLLA